MAGLLALIFWITLVGANDLSALLSRLFFSFQPVLDQALLSLHFPDWIRDAFVHGVYQVLAWVVSVMLPPMAIFFPLIGGLRLSAPYRLQLRPAFPVL